MTEDELRENIRQLVDAVANIYRTDPDHDHVYGDVSPVDVATMLIMMEVQAFNNGKGGSGAEAG